MSQSPPTDPGEVQPSPISSYNPPKRYLPLTPDPLTTYTPYTPYTPRTSTTSTLRLAAPLYEEPARINNEASTAGIRQSSRPKSLRPFILSIMAFKHGRKFSAIPSVYRKRRLSNAIEKKGQFSPALTRLYLGISAAFSDHKTALVAMALHDGVYLTDFSVKPLSLSIDGNSDVIADYVLQEVERYEHDNFVKFVGAGVPSSLSSVSTSLCSRLWLELDIVPIVIPDEGEDKNLDKKNFWDAKRVDEQADSMVRKCFIYFGPSQTPLLQVGFRGLVLTDAGFRVHLATLKNYQDTCSTPTWASMLSYAEKLKRNKIRIAFFSSTPQGNEVAVMRHALVRFAHLIGVDVSWYVPKPLPSALEITKKIQNILHGVSCPNQIISPEDKKAVIQWIADNADRYWFSERGPLRPIEDGGADVVIVDDPQMAGLIPMIRRLTPERPVIYRSHFQFRGDLALTNGSSESNIWKFLWDNIKMADLFISYPISTLVTRTVPKQKLAYMPATADWLDGLNKPLKDWDTGYYGNSFNAECQAQRRTPLSWPARNFILQVAYFDHSNGISMAISSYAEFRRQCTVANLQSPPQLVLCGYQFMDDHNSQNAYDEFLDELMSHCHEYTEDVITMRLGFNDQVVNTLTSKAHVVLGLSSSGAFETRLTEALHAGRPVIATNVGGNPIQIQDQVNGFLVEPDDSKAVANYLMALFTDEELHSRMSYAARTRVSDEVGTVGNALCWFYLASKLANENVGDCRTKLRPDGKWVYDMAREDAGLPYSVDEERLPRHIAGTLNVT
ncbi:Trehalose phosphorylase [Fusarium beomiforme]|uniref:Trehalose phosphorylase n=1 Tax=Fusarium beomiforme TaxID=44412 RepID=A0A9P5ALD7_9HYPO|nr:Trehalose phosphorylase [Fusarium beomiforme]